MVQLTWPRVQAFWMQRHFLEERLARGNLPVVVSRICGLRAGHVVGGTGRLGTQRWTGQRR